MRELQPERLILVCCGLSTQNRKLETQSRTHLSHCAAKTAPERCRPTRNAAVLNASLSSFAGLTSIIRQRTYWSNRAGAHKHSAARDAAAAAAAESLRRHRRRLFARLRTASPSRVLAVAAVPPPPPPSVLRRFAVSSSIDKRVNDLQMTSKGRRMSAVEEFIEHLLSPVLPPPHFYDIAASAARRASRRTARSHHDIGAPADVIIGDGGLRSYRPMPENRVLIFSCCEFLAAALCLKKI